MFSVHGPANDILASALYKLTCVKRCFRLSESTNAWFPRTNGLIDLLPSVGRVQLACIQRLNLVLSKRHSGWVLLVATRFDIVIERCEENCIRS